MIVCASSGGAVLLDCRLLYLLMSSFYHFFVALVLLCMGLPWESCGPAARWRWSLGHGWQACSEAVPSLVTVAPCVSQGMTGCGHPACCLYLLFWVLRVSAPNLLSLFRRPSWCRCGYSLLWSGTAISSYPLKWGRKHHLLSFRSSKPLLWFPKLFIAVVWLLCFAFGHCLEEGTRLVKTRGKWKGIVLLLGSAFKWSLVPTQPYQDSNSVLQKKGESVGGGACKQEAGGAGRAWGWQLGLDPQGNDKVVS